MNLLETIKNYLPIDLESLTFSKRHEQIPLIIEPIGLDEGCQLLSRKSKEIRESSEKMLFAHDIENLFTTAHINSEWAIAAADLSVFDAGSRAIGKQTLCAWIDGKDAPENLEYNGKLIHGVFSDRHDRLTFYYNHTKIGEARQLPGYVGATPEAVGWFLMLKNP